MILIIYSAKGVDCTVKFVIKAEMTKLYRGDLLSVKINMTGKIGFLLLRSVQRGNVV